MTDNSPPQRPSVRAWQAAAVGRSDISSHRDGKVQTISLVGEIDLSSAGDVERELLRAEAGDARLMRMDLSGLTFIDLTAIKLFVLADARARADGHRLALHGPSDPVLRVLRIAGLADRLPLGIDQLSAELRRLRSTLRTAKKTTHTQGPT